MKKFRMYPRHIILSILKGLGEATLRTIDEGFLNPNYAFTHPGRALLGLKIPQYKDKKPAKRSLTVMLYRLKQDGLVKNTGRGRSAQWHITAKGEHFLEQYDILLSEHVIPPKDEKKRIIIFDIPEKKKTQRDGLRRELETLDYAMLQKSVWIGERPLPQSFIKQIHADDLTPYIRIFEIAKRGTISGRDFEN